MSAVDTASPVTKVPLTLDFLRSLSNSTKISSYGPDIVKFAQGLLRNGEGDVNPVFVDCMEIFPYKGHKIDSVYNSFNNNLKKLKGDNPHWDDIQVIKADGRVLLINQTLLAGATADEDDSSDEEN